MSQRGAPQEFGSMCCFSSYQLDGDGGGGRAQNSWGLAIIAPKFFEIALWKEQWGWISPKCSTWPIMGENHHTHSKISPVRWIIFWALGGSYLTMMEFDPIMLFSSYYVGGGACYLIMMNLVPCLFSSYEPERWGGGHLMNLVTCVVWAHIS